MRVLLLGHGISYSASPAMQNAAFRAAGLDWTYELADVPPDRLPEAVAGLRGRYAAGANVTIPHKIAVMPLLDDLEGVYWEDRLRPCLHLDRPTVSTQVDRVPDRVAVHTQ